MSENKDYYDENYWKFQAPIGKIGGILNKFKFEEHIKPENSVLDFGCGGGFLLNEINASQKFGFEINPNARNHAKSLGIQVFDDLNKIENNSIDIVISNHAFEHVPTPLDSLKHLNRIIRPGGLLIVVIPCEQPQELEFQYRENDINQHLYTWCPQTFGNLVKLSGFEIALCGTIQHKWTEDVQKCYLDENYHERCRDYAKKVGNYQVKCIGRKI